jgi:hypothetical protein
VLARHPDARELSELSSTFKDLSAHYAKEINAARELITIGAAPVDRTTGPSELAAWTMIGNVILNLDEAITKG